MSVDSLALLRTTPDRRPPCGQPFFNIHWARALSSSALKEDAPRRRGTIRISNMNPKNIGPYTEGEGGSTRRGRTSCPPRNGGGKENRMPVADEDDLTEN